jgi:ubiquinone/menaquinone biosynthesis C-methylase UbiE
MKEKQLNLEEEKQHHDKWASEIDIAKISVHTYFESSTAPENRFIIKNMGNLRGKRILDLGCGAGENSVYFALKGAECIAVDYSSGMVNTAFKLAEAYGVRIEGRVMDAMNLDFPDNSFDFVYASNLLHHVDPISTLREMHRVLKPGGKACFWDPLKHNPIINIYRKIAKDVRTENEKPLDINIMRDIRSLFSNVIYDTFWLCTLWIFIRFYLIEGVDPNKERYWKKILSEEKRLRTIYTRLESLDNRLKKMPYIGRFAWNIAVVATK